VLAPNPRRVRIFAAEKKIELSLEEVDILAGQSRTPEFLAKNSSGGARTGQAVSSRPSAKA
jgi:glutathione S-transferase